MKPLMRSTVVALLVAAGLAGAGPVAAEMIKLSGDLKAANEVPPNNSTATGKAEATFDTATRTLTYTVTFTGLSGTPIGAHFHGPTDAGKNAGIVLPFATVVSPITGTAVLTEAQAADLLAGKWYANLHTAANPGGEIRGQMAR